MLLAYTFLAFFGTDLSLCGLGIDFGGLWSTVFLVNGNLLLEPRLNCLDDAWIGLMFVRSFVKLDYLTLGCEMLGRITSEFSLLII